MELVLNQYLAVAIVFFVGPVILHTGNMQVYLLDVLHKTQVPFLHATLIISHFATKASRCRLSVEVGSSVGLGLFCFLFRRI
jgi:hypothetical protein